MRIGFDMLAVQSPHHGHRGIGRYSRHLVNALLELDEGHEHVLYCHEHLPNDRIPRGPNADLRILRTEHSKGITTVSQAVDHLARTNPDDLDVLVVLSPFEHWSCYMPPSRPLRNRPAVAAIVYDMIPFQSPSEIDPPPSLSRFYRIADELRRYDVLLAISEATAADCRSLLGLSAGDRVRNISAASDPSFFVPDDTPIPSPTTRATLESLGISRPYVLNVGGMDERKNTRGLIDAFARLPAPIRRSHQLVVTCSVMNEDVIELSRYAGGAGIGDALVVTGEVSDAALLTLYQRCAAFAFPSHYEGFGLPILEAMHCGAAVVAGNNSSQVEVVGDAGLLANVGDPSDIAEKLGRILGEPGLAGTLGMRARRRAGQFRWEATARLALQALRGAVPARSSHGGRRRADRGHVGKPKIAFVSPFPPRRSGISDYSDRLLRELESTYSIDLYHDFGYRPDPSWRGPGLAARDARAFDRYAAVEDYEAIVYQMGNSRYHSFLYDLMLWRPGIVTLHDFCLAGFHLQYGEARGFPRGYLRDELLRWYPEHAGAIEERWSNWPWEWDAIAEECARLGWDLNRRLLESPNRVVVHSRWCVEQVAKSGPALAGRMALIPLGGEPRWVSPAERAAIRGRFGLPAESLLVAGFGLIRPEKLNSAALEAFVAVARADPSALFLLVGEEADRGEARRAVESLGISGRVRFLGRTSMEDFHDLAGAVDIGVNLRRPPTYGETSATLLALMSAGVATVVTDVATFADFPDDVVRKVRWEADGIEGVRRALIELATRPDLRSRLGEGARAHVATAHSWPLVARKYAELIERERRLGSVSREAERRRAVAEAAVASPARPAFS